MQTVTAFVGLIQFDARLATQAVVYQQKEIIPRAVTFTDRCHKLRKKPAHGRRGRNRRKDSSLDLEQRVRKASDVQ